eukprot:9489854-Pyramimonas_sp.AAC.2
MNRRWRAGVLYFAVDGLVYCADCNTADCADCTADRLSDCAPTACSESSHSLVLRQRCTRRWLDGLVYCADCTTDCTTDCAPSTACSESSLVLHASAAPVAGVGRGLAGARGAAPVAEPGVLRGGRAGRRQLHHIGARPQR